MKNIPKLLIFRSSYPYSASDIAVAKRIKDKGVKIFAIGHHQNVVTPLKNKTYFSQICTAGWFFILTTLGSTNADLSKTFVDKARQSKS